MTAAGAMAASAHPTLEWIKMTPIGVFVRDTIWVFPTLQSLHLIGMTMLVGVVGSEDEMTPFQLCVIDTPWTLFLDRACRA